MHGCIVYMKDKNDKYQIELYLIISVKCTSPIKKTFGKLTFE